MSKELELKRYDETLPLEYRRMLLAEVDKETKALMEQGQITLLPTITINHKEGTFSRDRETVDSLEGSILFISTTRACWSQNKSMPFCSSYGGVMGKVIENEEVDIYTEFIQASSLEEAEDIMAEYTSLQNENHFVSCKDCPYNKFGSSPQGGQAKACKEKRVIILKLKGYPLPYILTLPSTSIRQFSGFVTNMENNLHPLLGSIIKINLSVQQATYKYSIVQFRFVSLLPSLEDFQEAQKQRDKILPIVERQLSFQKTEETLDIESEILFADASDNNNEV